MQVELKIECNILRYAYILAGFHSKTAFQDTELFYVLGQDRGREITNEIRGSCYNFILEIWTGFVF